MNALFECFNFKIVPETIPLNQSMLSNPKLAVRTHRVVHCIYNLTYSVGLSGEHVNMRHYIYKIKMGLISRKLI